MSIIYLLIVLIQITTAVPNSIEKSVDYTSTMSGPSKETSDEWQLFTVTAYCGCEKCCGKTDRITATGTFLTAHWLTLRVSGHLLLRIAAVLSRPTRLTFTLNNMRML